MVKEIISKEDVYSDVKYYSCTDERPVRMYIQKRMDKRESDKNFEDKVCFDFIADIPVFMMVSICDVFSTYRNPKARQGIFQTMKALTRHRFSKMTIEISKTDGWDFIFSSRDNKAHTVSISIGIPSDSAIKVYSTEAATMFYICRDGDGNFQIIDSPADLEQFPDIPKF